EPPEARVFRFIDHTHSAAAQFFQYAVVRNSLSEKGLGVRHCRTSYQESRARSERESSVTTRALISRGVPSCFGIGCKDLMSGCMQWATIANKLSREALWRCATCVKQAG